MRTAFLQTWEQQFSVVYRLVLGLNPNKNYDILVIYNMDPSVQRLLNDKLYDKRKQGALEYVVSIFFSYSSN